MRNKNFLLLLLMVSLGCSILSKAEGPGKPNVFVLDPETLSNYKKKLKVDQSLLPAYKELLKDAEEALHFGPVSVMEKKHMPPSGSKHDYMSLAPYYWPDPTKPNGLPYIRKDGETNPEVKDYKDKEYMPQLCEHVYNLALAWYYSDDDMYAKHATKLVRVWFLDTATRMNPNLEFGQAMKGHNSGRGAGLIDSRHFIKIIDAIGILKDSKYWKKEDQQGMKKWFADFLHWMQTSPNGIDEMDAPNNHGTWYDAQRLSLALFIEQTELAKKIITSAQQRLDSQLNDQGFFPKEMERTISLHYTSFVMSGFFTIALMSDNAGIDFWNYKSPSGKSLSKAFNTLKPYLVKKKEWEGKQIKPYDFEEGYFLLVQAQRHLGCKDCEDYIKELARDKNERLRIKLLY